MRKLSAILFAGLLVLGLASCDDDPINPLPTEPVSLTLTPTAVTLKVDETTQLTATVEPRDRTFTITFTSDNEQVATVDAKGLVKAVAEGRARITARVGSLTEQCAVTVSKSAPSIKLELRTPTLTIQKGKTAQIDYTVTPADTPVTFVSDKTEIATVDAQGVVTAIAAGSATITLAAAGQEAQVAVTVTDNGGGKTPQGLNELPILNFNPEYNFGDGLISDPEILDHEAQLGRVSQPITIGTDEYGQAITITNSFVNTDLTITAVAYRLATEDGEDAILALSKESIADCPKTLAMLAEYGFTSLQDEQFQGGAPAKVGKKNDDPSISVQLYDEPISQTQSILSIAFIKSEQEKEIETDHPILPAVKDFPNYAALMTGDVAKIKAAEEQIGLREYWSGVSDEPEANLMFATKDDLESQTNIKTAYYVYTPTRGVRFVNCMVNFIKRREDLSNPKIKEWFTANGFGENYRYDVEQGVATSLDATGKVACEIYIDTGRNRAYLRVFGNETTESARVTRRLASEQYDRVLYRPIPVRGLKALR